VLVDFDAGYACAFSLNLSYPNFFLALLGGETAFMPDIQQVHSYTPVLSALWTAFLWCGLDASPVHPPKADPPRDDIFIW